MSDCSGDCIVVYETLGQFVTSFGRPGCNEGEFHGFSIHSVSPLVLMVLYMYVTIGTTEFRYSRDCGFV